MGHKPREIKPRHTVSDCMQWDDKKNKLVPGYEQDCKIFETETFVDGVLFNSTDEAFTSDWFECGAFTNFLLLIKLLVDGTPTDIAIAVEFSSDEAEGYKLMTGPFGDLRYEDGAGDKKECLGDFVRGRFMRIYVLSSGCSAGNTFRLTLKSIFS